ncbi:Sulfotransferase domain protein [Enhygromyxa salina]|uniref:Sulfotransferase domain protein n=1 Tax=Enhygromyxa salina TaxID=215803 RepID=A0A2S9YBB7_9BACT|nr:sulfotransferase [Enhygromyxa salina]PRQ02404.1 Sulfotransferase domain protein [Enhygromyxa salina]
MSRLEQFDDPPIIVGGCGRSGTTLLLALLGAHPEIHAIPHETRLFCLFAEQSQDPAERRELLEDPSFGAAARLARLETVLARDPLRPSARRWCEKTPRNVLCFEEISELFTGRVKLVEIVRDGRDVVLSRHPLQPDHSWVSPARWVRDVAAGRRAAERVEVHTLRYEDLTREPEATLAKLGAELGLAGLDELDGWRERTNIQRSGAWREGGVQPVSTAATERWRAQPDHPKVRALLAEPGARELLDYHGYLDP